ncbi:MAG: hypothetical protein A2Y34_10835 [Spirochaetes bacterium GWC1_27_15]|nr:MAG: hypothetical protein A2Z98_04495 [Spirochaetes bacterium GWB1_27_13]OHD25405.1 MAG: hypothetical protein A2Y34_10835 [Spirochaetes bacterium GWC1_27_15]
MKKLLVIAFAMVLIFAFIGCKSMGGGGSLPSFGADMGAQSTPLGTVRVPYTSMVSYFGYVKPGAAADEERDGKKFFYLYVWIPAIAPEIGVRMVSPVKNLAKPTDKDYVSDLWAEGSKDMDNYFDTWVTFERALDIIMPEDIPSKIDGTKWVSYGSNDDSSELPAQPSGSKYNSVLRITSEVSNPLKALIRGLYRIGFTTYKVGEVQGTFVAQVGAPIDLPGVVVVKDKDKILDAINAKASK